MHEFAYAYMLIEEGDEIFLEFPKFGSDLICSIDAAQFKKLNEDEVREYARDAVVIALQTIIASHDEIPEADSSLVVADDFVHLCVRHAMKIKLYELYRANFSSISQFAKKIEKPKTSAHRLLDLRHRSRTDEIEQAFEALGKRLVHGWKLEAA
jgi:hypothetical protein